MSGHRSFVVLSERKFITLADLFRDDVSCNAMSLYFREGIIDSDELKKDIQEAIDISEHQIPTYAKELRDFLEYVILVGERGPVRGWNAA